MKKRLCHHVISRMLAFVPDDQTELISALKWNYEDSIYKAPEETLQWNRTMQTLQKYIPKPTEEWHFDILSLFTTKTVEELKEITNN